MKITIRKASYAYEWLNGYEPKRPTLICLHGFMGSKATFFCLSQQQQVNILALDLLGHGQSSIYLPAYRYTMSELMKDLQLLVQQLRLTKFYLLGYSMGSRVALAWGLTYPESIAGLIMEAGTPGLIGAENRAKRRVHDKKWCQMLQECSMTQFVQSWQAQALFASQRLLPIEQQQAIFQAKSQQVPYGLAMSLQNMGTGAQMNYWSSLTTKGKFPLLYLAGQLDHKYLSLGQQVVQAWGHPQATLTIIEAAGHCTHLEQPLLFQTTVLNWLASLEK